LRELLDPSLGLLEAAEAEAQELLAALPQPDRLVEIGLPPLEPLDDLLQLPLRGLERQLADGRTSSTRALSAPSVSSTSTRCPSASVVVLLTMPSLVRTIA
jgi:hypothetical protein